MSTAPAAIDWAKIETLVPKQEPDSIPPGWFTCKEYAKNTNRSTSSAFKILSRCVQGGTIITQTFRIDVGTKVYPVPHYKILDAA
jgi:hypothetical protein